MASDSDFSTSQNPLAASLAATSGSGFYDRTELVERHRQQRDRMRARLRQLDNGTPTAQLPLNPAEVAVNENPFAAAHAAAIVATPDPATSRPSTHGRPMTGGLDCPPMLEDFDDPYDAAMVAQLTAKYGPTMRPTTTPDQQRRRRDRQEEMMSSMRGDPRYAGLSEAELKALQGSAYTNAMEALQHIQSVLASYDSDDDRGSEADEEERMKQRDELREGIDRRLESISRVDMHLEEFLAKHSEARELGDMIKARKVEIDLIRNNIEELGARRHQELSLYQWEQELTLREDRRRKMLSKQIHETKDVACSTVTPLPDYDDNGNPLPQPSYHLRHKSVVLNAEDLAEVNHHVPGSRRSSVATTDDPASPASAKKERRGERGFRAAKAIGMMTARRKGLRSNSPSDEQRKAKAHRDYSKADDDAVDTPLCTAQPPSGRIVFVSLEIKFAEVGDAWERETNAFLRHSQRVMRIVIEKCNDNGAYVIQASRVSYSVVVDNDAAALKLVAQVHDALLHMEWSMPLCRFRNTAAVVDPKFETRTVFKGLRLSVGMHVATISTATPWKLRQEADVLTQRVFYIGPEATVAAQLAMIARGGETIMSAAAWEQMKEHSPIATFTEYVAKESTLRLTPDEARQSAIGASIVGVGDDGSYLLPIVTVYSYELQNRRAVLGPHPREVEPPAAPEAGTGDSDSDTGNTATTTAEFLGGTLERGASRAVTPRVGPASEAHRPVALNNKALRASVDTSHATFVVVTVPHLAKLLAQQGGAGCHEVLRGIMLRLVDNTNQSKTFFNRSTRSSAEYDAAAIVSHSFDETVVMFKSEPLACQWALTLHDELRSCDWPLGIGHFYRAHCSEPDVCEHWGGLRVAIGVGSSAPQISTHRGTGLYTYDGVGLMIARELALAARPGETVLPAKVADVIHLRGVPRHDYVTECLNPTKSTKDTQLFALYSKHFAQRCADLGPLRHDVLVKLLSNIHEIRTSLAEVHNPNAKRVTAASLAQSKNTDQFLAVAQKLCTSHVQFEHVMRTVNSGQISDRVADLFVMLLKQAEKQGLVSAAVLDESEPAHELVDDDVVLVPVLKRAEEVARAQREDGALAKSFEDGPVEEFFAVDLPGRRRARAVLTQTPLDFIPSGSGYDSAQSHLLMQRTAQFLHGSRAPAGEERDSAAAAEPKEKKQRAAKKAAGPSHMTSKEKEDAREAKWKALHKALTQRKEQGEVAKVADDYMKMRREERLKMILEKKAREEDLRQRKKALWRKRQESKKEALREIIRQKITEIVVAQNKAVAPKPKDFVVGRAHAEPDAAVGFRASLSAVTPPQAPLSPPARPISPQHLAGHRSRSTSPVPQITLNEEANRVHVDHAPTHHADVASESRRLSSHDGDNAPATQHDPHAATMKPSAENQIALPGDAATNAPQRGTSDPAAADASRTVNLNKALMQKRQSAADEAAVQRSKSEPTSPMLTLESLAAFAERQADDLAATAFDRLSLSSLSSSVLSILQESDNGDDDSSADAGSDVEELLVAAGLKPAAAQSVPPPVAGGGAAAGAAAAPHPVEATPKAEKAERWERKARKLMKEAMVAEQPHVPRKHVGVQVDLGPRLLVKKVPGGATDQPRRTVAPATFTVHGEATVPSNREATRKYDEQEDLPIAPAVQSGVVVHKGFKAGHKKQPATTASPTSARSGKTDAGADAGHDDLLMENATARADMRVHEDEMRRHNDDDDEVLDYENHMTQRRDIITDFVFAGQEFLRDIDHASRSKDVAPIVPLLRRSHREVFHPLSHYLRQLADGHAGVERERAVGKLDIVDAFTRDQDAARRADATLLWHIAFQRMQIEAKSKRALAERQPTLQRAKWAVVAAMLKKLSVMHEQHRQLRAQRLARLRCALQELFDDVATIPQVGHVALTQAPELAFMALPQPPEHVADAPSPRAKLRRGHGAALRAAGVANVPKVQLPDATTYHAMASMLKEFEPTLDVLPHVLEQGMQPVDAGRAQDAAVDDTDDVPADSTRRGPVSDSETVAAVSGAVRSTNALDSTKTLHREYRSLHADHVVGKTTETQRQQRVAQIEIERRLHESDTSGVAKQLDRLPGRNALQPVETTGAVDPNRPTTEDGYREWLVELNARIDEHRTRVLHDRHHVTARAPSPTSAKATSVVGGDARHVMKQDRKPMPPPPPALVVKPSKARLPALSPRK